MMNKQTKRIPRRALALALTSTLVLAGGWLAASSAQAGLWMQDTCLNPNQSPAPSEGWSQFASGAPGYGSVGSARCPMFGLLSSAAAEANGNGENLRYQPPAGSTLIGGSVDASGYAGGGGTGASATVEAYAPEFVYPGDVIYQCAEADGTCSPGSYSFSTVISLPADTGGDFYIGAGCGGTPGYSCDSGESDGAWSDVEVHWADFLLANEATPNGSAIGGTLLSPNAEGTAELTLTATDPGGPGVYLVTVQIDGKTVYSGTPNNNSGKCVPVGSSGSALMFDYSQPCPTSESDDLPINTTSLANGQHTLKILVQDAAGNSAVVYDGTISTKQPSNNSRGAQPGPGTTTSSSPPPPPPSTTTTGVPNGTQASQTAQLTLGLKHRMNRTYTHSALRVTGRLLNGEGQPIADATLDVLQQINGSPNPSVIARAHTNTGGTFLATVPGGPTRIIEVAYRAFSTDTSYAASAAILETVSASVTLEVTPRRTNSEGTITLSGRVLGPIPARGVHVELLVHYRGRWEPFRTPQTDSRGFFEAEYKFEGGIGRFPFRARVFSGQTGFPFDSGKSRKVDVTTR
ncbi:MAG: hypothetical protein ABSH36_09840 [Solirubrobacteraceae bacterium]